MVSIDLVIFRVFKFSRIFYFGTFTKFRIREFLFSFSSAIIIIIFAICWIRKFVLLATFAQIKTSRILSDLQYVTLCLLFDRYQKNYGKPWSRLAASSLNVISCSKVSKSTTILSTCGLTAKALNYFCISYGEQRVLKSLSDSFEYLCYGSTAIINILLLLWGSTFDVRIWRLQTSDSDV